MSWTKIKLVIFGIGSALLGIFFLLSSEFKRGKRIGAAKGAEKEAKERIDRLPPDQLHDELTRDL